MNKFISIPFPQINRLNAIQLLKSLRSLHRSNTIESLWLLSTVLTAVSLIAGCGGGGASDSSQTDQTPSVSTVNLQASVTGLSSGMQVVLRNSQGDSLTISGNGTYSFPHPVALGSNYNLSVATQPSGQTCSVNPVSNTAIATAGGSITIEVNCSINTYVISGAVSGLPAGASVTLAVNGTIAIAQGNGNFSFPAPLAYGTRYVVTAAAPTGYTCLIHNGEGTLISSVANVTVNCAGFLWTWQGGADTVAAKGIYGTLGTATVGSAPGARNNATQWVDAKGKLWLFGGAGLASTNTVLSYLNDLWSYDPITGLWTWQSGATSPDAIGRYGAKGVADLSNMPGARVGGMSWTDASGKLWLFGGSGYDTNGVFGPLNDLWSFDVGARQWIWQGGANTLDQKGTYGVRGVSAATNNPGARGGASTWTDGAGKVWLFGGYGRDAFGNIGSLNDLWTYDPANNCWTWQGGSTMYVSAGSYGVLGVAAASNIPPARASAAQWIDDLGRLWLFGGLGHNTSGQGVGYHDLWSFDPASGLWTWQGGTKGYDLPGNYGSQGVAAATNMPGTRFNAASWVDNKGRLWMHGGYGFDAAGNNRYLSDLWSYDLSTGLWTWQGGTTSIDTAGSYGARGTATTTNLPGARASANVWQDGQGKVWLFGGFGYDSVGQGSVMNDLWSFSSY